MRMLELFSSACISQSLLGVEHAQVLYNWRVDANLMAKYNDDEKRERAPLCHSPRPMRSFRVVRFMAPAERSPDASHRLTNTCD
eukprot:4407407-Pleurochrysis_carterae.AAC.2